MPSRTLAKIARYLPLYRELLQIRLFLKRIHFEIRELRAMEAMRYHQSEKARRTTPLSLSAAGGRDTGLTGATLSSGRSPHGGISPTVV
jgi:hypothetical protein